MRSLLMLRRFIENTERRPLRGRGASVLPACYREETATRSPLNVAANCIERWLSPCSGVLLVARFEEAGRALASAYAHSYDSILRFAAQHLVGQRADHP